MTALYIKDANQAPPLLFHVARDITKIRTGADGYGPWGHAIPFKHSGNLGEPMDLYATLNMHGHKNEPKNMMQLCFTQSFLYMLVYLSECRHVQPDTHVLIAYGPELAKTLLAGGGHLFQLAKFYEKHEHFTTSIPFNYKREDMAKHAKVTSEWRSTGTFAKNAVAVETNAHGIFEKNVLKDVVAHEFLSELKTAFDAGFSKPTTQGPGTNPNWESGMTSVALFCIKFWGKHSESALDCLVDALCHPQGMSPTPASIRVHGLLTKFGHIWHGNLRKIGATTMLPAAKASIVLASSDVTWQRCGENMPKE